MSEYQEAARQVDDLYFNRNSAEKLLAKLRKSKAMFPVSGKAKVTVQVDGEEVVLLGNGVCASALSHYLDVQIQWVESQISGMDKLIEEMEKQVKKIHDRLPEVLG